MSSSATSGLMPFPLSGLVNAGSSKTEARPVSSDPADELLLGRIANQDKEALAALFQRHAALVRGIGNRILRDTGEAEDLVQEVFLYLYRKAALFDRAKSSARSWIVQVTYYQAMARRRYLLQRHCRAPLRRPDGPVDSYTPVPMQWDYPEEAFYNSALVSEIWETLTNSQRETLRLHFFEGYSLSEISVKLGEPLGNVRHHYYRGLDRLRSRLLPK